MEFTFLPGRGMNCEQNVPAGATYARAESSLY